VNRLVETDRRSVEPIDSDGRFTEVGIDVNTGQIVKEVRYIIGQDSRMIYDYSQEQFERAVIEPARRLLEPAAGLAEYIPSFSFEWSLNAQNKPKGYIIMDKIEGVGIEDVPRFSPELSGELDNIISRSLDLENSTASNGTYIRPDIFDVDSDGEWSLKNIMVGSLKRGRLKPYIIDVYPANWEQTPRFPHEIDPLVGLMKRLSAKSNGFSYPKTTQAMAKYRK
jgi:hypothetical protein